MAENTIESNVNFDLGILTTFDSNSLWTLDQDKELDETIKSKFIKERAEKNILRLFQKFYEIKTERDAKREAKDEELQIHDFESSIWEIKLPKKTTVFPRQKRLPEIKKQTKWEKFAQERGIRKKQRDFKVFDETTGDYGFRWGRHSVQKHADKENFAIEVKKGEDIYEDPFQKKSLEKTLEKEQQKLRELNNKLKDKGIQPAAFMGKTFNSQKKTEKLREKTKKSLQVAQISTASAGVFDQKAHKEEQQMKIKKRRNNVSFKDLKQEQSRDLDILDLINRNEGSKKIKKE